jgi:hypothetical protein
MTTQSEPLGYVVANVGAERAPCLSSTSVMSREDAEHEARQWAKAGERYVVCEVRVAP